MFSYKIEVFIWKTCFKCFGNICSKAKSQETENSMISARQAKIWDNCKKASVHVCAFLYKSRCYRVNAILEHNC